MSHDKTITAGRSALVSGDLVQIREAPENHICAGWIASKSSLVKAGAKLLKTVTNSRRNSRRRRERFLTKRLTRAYLFLMKSQYDKKYV